MYLVEDGNGSPDIILFDGGIFVIDGWTTGSVNLPNLYDISGFSLVFILIGILGLSFVLFLKKRFPRNIYKKIISKLRNNIQFAIQIFV
ncbi:MAG: hypothetical protein ACFFD2_13550 [Promethearchaeota archaeon]